MRKLIFTVAIVLFLNFVLTSCKSSGPHCQAYSSKVEKSKTDKSEKPL